MGIFGSIFNSVAGLANNNAEQEALAQKANPSSHIDPVIVQKLVSESVMWNQPSSLKEFYFSEEELLIHQTKDKKLTEILFG